MRALLVAPLLALALLPAPAAAQPADEAAFVRGLLARVLPLSHAKGIEHCGYVGRDAAGRLAATGPVPGTRDTCTSPWPRGLAVTASWHTHGGFLAGYHGELPSAPDLRSDRALGIGGWLGTPGGRLWHIDSRRMATRQVCPAGCLPVAPGYDPAASGPIAASYGYEALLRRLAE